AHHQHLERKLDFFLRVAGRGFVDDVYALFRRDRSFLRHAESSFPRVNAIPGETPQRQRYPRGIGSIPKLQPGETAKLPGARVLSRRDCGCRTRCDFPRPARALASGSRVPERWRCARISPSPSSLLGVARELERDGRIEAAELLEGCLFGGDI